MDFGLASSSIPPSQSNSFKCNSFKFDLSDIPSPSIEQSLERHQLIENNLEEIQRLICDYNLLPAEILEACTEKDFKFGEALDQIADKIVGARLAEQLIELGSNLRAMLGHPESLEQYEEQKAVKICIQAYISVLRGEHRILRQIELAESNQLISSETAELCQSLWLSSLGGTIVRRLEQALDALKEMETESSVQLNELQTPAENERRRVRAIAGRLDLMRIKNDLNNRTLSIPDLSSLSASQVKHEY